MTKYYAFEEEGVPAEAEYLEVLWPVTCLSCFIRRPGISLSIEWQFEWQCLNFRSKIVKSLILLCTVTIVQSVIQFNDVRLCACINSRTFPLFHRTSAEKRSVTCSALARPTLNFSSLSANWKGPAGWTFADLVSVCLCDMNVKNLMKIIILNLG